MTDWRRATALLGLVLAMTSCAGDVGPGTPACLDQGGTPDIAAVTLLQLQAVPDATYGPCIAELKVGWGYGTHLTESGRASFWLDSDRMGDRFLEARLTPACDAAGALPAPSPQGDIERLIRVDEQPGPVQIAIIPVSPRHSNYAGSVLAELAGVDVEGRALAPFVPDSNAPAAVQVERALANGQIVVVLDDREEATGTVEMRRSGEEARMGITVHDVVEAIEDDLESPRYRAEWFHRFSGGCITYVINAEGAGAELIVSEVDDVLSFFPLAQLRTALEDQGFDA